MEDQEVELNMGLFRKGFNMKDMEKFLEKLIKIENKRMRSQNCEEENAFFGGVFTVKTLL
jgi:hypothetical protein